MNSIAAGFVDTSLIVKRDVIKHRRRPERLIFSTLAPIMYVFLFGLVFGSAINSPGVPYPEFLMAGVLTHTLMFRATTAGIGLVEDIRDGAMDRLRSAPIARSAVLAGRTFSDLLTSALVLVVMTAAGLVIGWRPHAPIWSVAAGFGVLLAFSYAASWLMAVVGLQFRKPEVFVNASFIVVFPLTSVAKTFVDTTGMPGPLRSFAEWNPLSSVAQAVRVLFGNVPIGEEPSAVWPLRHPIPASLGWIAATLIIFVPLAAWQFRRAVER